MTSSGTINEGDVLDWIARYEGEPFHALLCDPPYHLTSIVKRFQNGEPAHTKTANDIKHRLTPHARQAAGFMGKRWDGGDLAFRPETWEAFSSVLHPGAFCMAFAGTRGYHRMACAIEDAGYIIHPMMVYCFGSGFPKATRIGKFDRTLRSEPRADREQWRFERGTECEAKPVTETAKVWADHRYGLQALKPALEPICVFQKPYKGKPAECITKTGAGAFNIGAGRIQGSAGVRKEEQSRNGGVFAGKQSRPYIEEALAAGIPSRSTYETPEAGRWPSNFLISDDCAPLLDAQSGVLTSGNLRGEYAAGMTGVGTNSMGFAEKNYGSNSGGASRFFFQSDYQAEEYEPFFYCAKAGKLERSAGVDSVNNHPTVKSLKLTRYLAALLLPPAEYAPRRLFVPFSGSGSEVCGALLAGWESVVGVEGEVEYCEIARARIKFWTANTGLFDSLTQEEEDSEPAQEAMEF